MSEALSNNGTVTGTFGAPKAQDQRKAKGLDGIEYASFAGMAHAAADPGAMGAMGVKAASQQLPGFASRDRGTSSRAYAANGSAARGIAPPTDPTSLANQEMKSGSSWHDPAARLEGKVPSQAQGEAATKGSMEARGTGETGRGAAAVKSGGSATAPAAPSAVAAGSMDGANATVQAAAGATPPARATGSLGGSTPIGLGGKVSAALGAGRVAGAASGSAGQGNAGQANGRGVATQGPPSAANGTTGKASVRGFEISMRKAKGEAAGKSGGAGAQERAVDAQAVRGLAAVLRQKGGVVTLRLAPESLGDLKISMRLDGSSVWASIEATTETARQLLEDRRESLRGALEAHGLRVERLEVSAVKPEGRDESQRPGMKDHPGTHDPVRHEQSALAGEDRRSSGQWGGTPRESGPGGSAGPGEEAGGAGEMVLTVRGAPVTVWTEPQGQSVRLRVDAVA